MSADAAPMVLHTHGPLGPTDAFNLEVSLAPSPISLGLTIDLYDADDPVDPGGHYSWWQWQADGRSDYRFTVDSRGPETVRLDVPPRAQWVNPDLDVGSAKAVAVHVVLRDFVSEEVLVDRSILWLQGAPPAVDPFGYIHDLAKPSFEMTQGGVVHVTAADIRRGDAIGNLALDVAQALDLHGIRVRLWSNSPGGRAELEVAPAAELAAAVGPADLIFHQHSIGDPTLEVVLETSATKVCYYHGVTPPQLLKDADPDAADICAAGIAQLQQLGAFDGLIAGSSFTAMELRAAVGDRCEVTLCPPMLNLDRFEAVEAAAMPSEVTGPYLLYVGRFAAHKGIDLLIEAFAAHHALDPNLDLVLAGSPPSDRVAQVLETQLAQLPDAIAGQIHRIRRPSDAVLKTLYTGCAAVVSTSRHEGFCVPLVEAMTFSKPIFAFDAGAVAETLADGGTLFTGRDAEELARLWHDTLEDRDRIAGQLAQQAERLAELRPATDGRLIWDVLGKALAKRRG